jgi:hypothetical protein
LIPQKIAVTGQERQSFIFSKIADTDSPAAVVPSLHTQGEFEKVHYQN